MFIILALVFILVPVIEFRILWSLSESIGIIQTLALIVLTGIVGAYLARSQGIKVLNSIKDDLEAGTMPADSILSAALVLIGGILLITPGIMTDAFGFCLLIPPFRSVLALLLKKYIQANFNIVNYGTFSQANTESGTTSSVQEGFVDVNVVDDKTEEKSNN